MSAAERKVERIRARDGCELHCEITGGNAQKWLVCVHGIGEHLGRARHLAAFLASDRNVLQFDLRGHGQSEGRRGYIDAFETFYTDLEDVVRFLASRHPNVQYVLFGHSMGALIAAGFTQRRPKTVPLPERLFLASPPVGLGGRGGMIVNRLPRRIVSGLCRVPFSLPLGSTINRDYLSHEPKIGTRYLNDPLSLNRLHSRLLVGLVDASRTVFSRPIGAQGPLFAAIGSDDRVVSCAAARRYFATHEPNAEFRIIEGGYHELHNETANYREPYFEFLKSAILR